MFVSWTLLSMLLHLGFPLLPRISASVIQPSSLSSLLTLSTLSCVWWMLCGSILLAQRVSGRLPQHLLTLCCCRSAVLTSRSHRAPLPGGSSLPCRMLVWIPLFSRRIPHVVLLPPLPVGRAPLYPKSSGPPTGRNPLHSRGFILVMFHPPPLMAPPSVRLSLADSLFSAAHDYGR